MTGTDHRSQIAAGDWKLDHLGAALQPPTMPHDQDEKQMYELIAIGKRGLAKQLIVSVF